MPDNLSAKDRRKTMRAVKGKGTSLERRLAATLAGMGLRGWKKNVDDVPGKPDVVFFQERVAIFVDGCFWHGCPHCNRPLPETNREYWEHKIERNVERDKQNTQHLVSDGWCVLRFWEHELRDETEKDNIRHKIRDAVKKGEIAE